MGYTGGGDYPWFYMLSYDKWNETYFDFFRKHIINQTR